MKISTKQLYEPYRKHAVLYEGSCCHDWIHPDLRNIREALQDDNPLPSTLKEELSGSVYSFECFTEEFLKLFLEELQNFHQASEKYKIPVHRPNSMNNYGVIVNEIGLQPLITTFQQEYLLPLSRKLWPKEGSQFDDYHSFTVRYRASEDLGLDMHTDDSDVTFNVCLGESFTGATLQFCGSMGAPNHRHASHTYTHAPGRAVLHLGSRRHGADDIESGTRVNLIVWNHNYQFRASSECKRRKRLLYESEASPPDAICLSYTHDVDYTIYKALPERARQLQLNPWCPPLGQEYEGFDQECRDKNK